MTLDQTENTPLLEPLLSLVALCLPSNTVMGTVLTPLSENQEVVQGSAEGMPECRFGEGDNDKILQDFSISVAVIWNQWMHHYW